MLGYRIGASAIDNEFKLLTNLDVDLDGKQRIFWFSVALDLLCPSTFRRPFSELTEDFHSVDVAKIKLTCVEVDCSTVQPMPFDLLIHSDTPVRSLELAYTLDHYLSVLILVSLPNRLIDF